MKLDKLVKLARTMLDLPTSRNRHFSFLLVRNKVLSVGYSLGYTTHPLAKKYGHRFNAIHSELSVIKNFPYPPSLLSKCKIVNIRIMRDGSLGMSRPCKHCQQLLHDLDITDIWYTNEQGEFTQQ